MKIATVSLQKTPRYANNTTSDVLVPELNQKARCKTCKEPLTSFARLDTIRDPRCISLLILAIVFDLGNWFHKRNLTVLSLCQLASLRWYQWGNY